MKIPVSLLCLLSLAAGAFAAGTGNAVVIPLRGEVSKAQFFFVRRAIKTAERENASALILDMQTYGGDAFAAIDIMDALMKSSVPTYTLVNNKAISAGALIAIATQKIYMTPTGVIGAAAPVMAGGEDLPSTMKDKTVSALSAVARAASQKNGHSADLADAFIDREKEVKIGDKVIKAKGSLLTLTALEAVQSYNGKPLLATGLAESVDDLARKEKLTGSLQLIEPTGFEMLAFWITQLAPLFLLGGIIGAYLEIKLHGTMIPGFVAAVCFIIFFTGHYLAGLAGWEVFVIFFIGVALVISELALHPGTILPGLVGLLLMAGSLLWAMIDHYPGQPFIPTPEMLTQPIIKLGTAILGGGVLIYLLGKILPKTTFYNRLVLGTAGAQGPSLAAASIDSPALVKVGDTGEARSILRPSGKAAFGGTHLDVITEGEFVHPGTRIRVVAIEGPRIVVETC
jgi:membrane-bound serine protease (ClpP class)